MRKIAVGFLGLVVACVVGSALFSVQADDNLTRADARLRATERQVATVVGTSQRTAGAVGASLTPASIGGLGARLSDFARDTARVEQVSVQLRRDIERYEQARTATLASLREELRSITSEATRRQLLHVQDEADSESAARLMTARESAQALRLALEQGADLVHAARVIELATQLHAQGQDLDNQIQHAQTAVAEYARLTTSLLARLSSANGD